MSGVVSTAVARSSASLCRRTHQQGWRGSLVQPGTGRTTPTASRPVRNNSNISSSRGSGSSSSSSRCNGGGGSSNYGDWHLVPLAPRASVLLATVLLCSTSDQRPAEAGWWPFGRRSTSPFDNTVPKKAKRQRAKAEVEMREYLSKMRVPVQELMAGLRKGEVSREEFDKRMASFNNEVELATHRIIFGVVDPPAARRVFEAEHGNCRYTPDAIRAVAALSPLIEIGAGRGHWQRALSEAGAAVVAFDKWATNPGSRSSKGGMTAGMPQVGKVLPGDEHAIRLHRDKTLLLVYPPPGDTALRCLRDYRGDAFAYVGEGRGGANASNEFFDSLDTEWEVTSVLDLDPFPQCFERLYLLRRRREVVASPSQQEVGENGIVENLSDEPRT